MPQSYVRNHIASRSYLDAFTDETGFLMVLRRSTMTATRARPERVGFRNKFWGREEHVRESVERTLSTLEGAAADVLRDIPCRGLPATRSKEREALLEFLALHYVRSPIWRALINEPRVKDQATSAAAARDRIWTDSATGRSSPVVREDAANPWLEFFYSHLHQFAAVLACMHWSLVAFDGPWLWTCDQPMVPVPLLDGPIPRLSTRDTPVVTDTLEYFFVISPSHALVLTWVDIPEDLHPVVLDYADAANINRVVSARADQELFYLPGPQPPLVAAPWSTSDSMPMSARLFPTYSSRAARKSERRRRAIGLLNEYFEKDLWDVLYTRIEMTYGGPSADPALAAGRDGGDGSSEPGSGA